MEEEYAIHDKNDEYKLSIMKKKRPVFNVNDLTGGGDGDNEYEAHLTMNDQIQLQMNAAE